MSEPPRDPTPAAPRDPSRDPTEVVRIDQDATQRMAPAPPPPPPPAVPPAAAAPPPASPPPATPASPPESAQAAAAPRPPAVPGRAQVARPSPVRFFALLALGLVVLLALVALLSRGGGRRGPGEAAGPSGTAAAPEVRVLAVVRDLPGELAILSDGHVRGLDTVAEAEQRRVARAVTTGELSPAAGAAALRGGADAVPVSAPLRLLAPVATRVSDERPLLRWTPAEEAGAYVVTVADAGGQVLATSPPLAATEWRPPRALPRQRTLDWFVETRPRGRGAEPVRSAVAHFAVLGGEEVAWLEREIEAGARSLLLTAVLEAEVGAFDDARAALDELIAANPASPELARLRERLRAMPAARPAP